MKKAVITDSLFIWYNTNEIVNRCLVADKTSLLSQEWLNLTDLFFLHRIVQ